MAPSSPLDNFEVPFSAASAVSSGRLAEPTAATVARTLRQPVTPVLAAFFDPPNVDVIQNALLGRIRADTGYAIDRQSDADMHVIMRKVYAERAGNAPGDAPADVQREVRRLNGLVLDVVVPMVASNVAGYLGYLRDASRLPEPLPRAVQVSVKGTKPNELFRPL